MGLVAFKNPLAVRQTVLNLSQMSFAHDSTGRPVLVDEVLGQALGYADPLEAIERLCWDHGEALAGHTAVAEVDPPMASGRSQVRAFDLEGAMHLCRLAKTPASAQVFGFLKKAESHNAIVEFEEELQEASSFPSAGNVLPFPRRSRLTR